MCCTTCRQLEVDSVIPDTCRGNCKAESLALVVLTAVCRDWPRQTGAAQSGLLPTASLSIKPKLIKSVA